MRLWVGVLFVRLGEFARFRTSWHTVGTLENKVSLRRSFPANGTPVREFATGACAAFCSAEHNAPEIAVGAPASDLTRCVTCSRLSPVV